MEQRNFLSPHQMLDLGPPRHLTRFPPNDITASTGMLVCSDYLSPMQSSSGNSVNLGRQCQGHYDGISHFRNQYRNIQIPDNVPDFDFVNAAAPNFHNPYIVHPMSCRFFSFPQSSTSAIQYPCTLHNTPIATNMNAYGVSSNLYIDNSRRSCKRKNALMPGSYSHENGIVSSLPSYQAESSEVLQRDSAAFNTDSHANCILPTAEIPHRTVRCRPGAPDLQPESDMIIHHYNNVRQGNNIGVSYQLPTNEWMVQSGNVGGDGSVSTWNNINSMNYVSGRSINSASSEMANNGMQGYLEPSHSTSTGFAWHPSCLPNIHHPFPPGQNIQSHSYPNHTQLHASYECFSNNMHHNQNTLAGMGVHSRFEFCPSGAEMAFRTSRLQPQPGLSASAGCFRILPEEAALWECRTIYGVENLIDQHRDMRLDIDGMSYEELLALEEKIGDVATGLTEECIVQNLKISVYYPDAKLLHDNVPQPNESCVICQLEYVEKDRIGALDCGHYYHVGCIKQWLLVKNMCPVCKESALHGNRSVGEHSLK